MSDLKRKAKMLAEAAERRRGRRPSVVADELGTDPTDPNAIVDLLTKQMLPSLIQQAKAGQLDAQSLTTYTNLLTGRASEVEKLNFASQALNTSLLQRMIAGELDDPEEATFALSEWGQQAAAIEGRLGQLPGAGAPTEAEDPLVTMYQDQLRRQAEMEQIQFRRTGVESILGMVPIAERFPTFVRLAQADPSLFRLFLGDMGSESATGGAAPLRQTQPFNVISELEKAGVK